MCGVLRVSEEYKESQVRKHAAIMRLNADPLDVRCVCVCARFDAREEVLKKVSV